MRFVKFNYLDGSSFGFCLDDLSVFHSDEEHTRIVLRNGHVETLAIDIDEFCAIVYSDEQDGEYRLIEIDEKEPPKSEFMMRMDDVNL